MIFGRRGVRHVAQWLRFCIKIAEETEFDIVKVDTDASQENAQLAMEYRVQGIPNMKIFVGGEEVVEMIGMKPKQTLIDALEKAAK